MRLSIAAALALAAAPSLQAQVPATSDLNYIPPAAGSWNYASSGAGSEAVFSTAMGPQLTLRCTRATRRVTILKPASTASATIWVWTSSQAKTVAASFDATTARIAADVAAFDPLLDAMALSRGRIGFSTGGAPALVVPAWSEVSRVVEDCRV